VSPATSILIRAARVGDEARVAEIHVRSWQAGYRGLLADDYLDGLRAEDRAPHYTFDRTGPDDVLTLVAVTDRVRGFVSLAPAAGEVWALYVDPTAWRSGVGRALLVEAQDRLAQRHARATLWVLAGNTRACRFYEANGWQPDGEQRREIVWGAALDELRYARSLPAAP
jgi:GNAT superfamily N-acetyltransferase